MGLHAPQPTVDFVLRSPLLREIINTAEGTKDLLLLMDGTPAVLNSTNLAAFTKTGGVGGAWTEESNFRTLLGAKAPVIAQACDNLLSSNNTSFEAGNKGNWHCAGCLDEGSVNNTDGWHGSHCLQGLVTTGSVYTYCSVASVTSAGSQYTYSCWLKAGNAAAVGKVVYAQMYGNISGFASGNAVTLSTLWQQARVVKTFDVNDTTRSVYVSGFVGHAPGDIYLYDGHQLESGAVQTPFALDYRTATTCSVANPFTAGQNLSLMFLVNTPWAGADGVDHSLFECRSGTGVNLIRVQSRAADNRLALIVYTGAGDIKWKYGTLNSTNWAANTNHIVIATVDASNTQQIYLDGTELTGSSGNSAREVTLGANAFIGIDYLGINNPLNGSILAAAWGRVLTAREINFYSKVLSWFPQLPLAVS